MDNRWVSVDLIEMELEKALAEYDMTRDTAFVLTQFVERLKMRSRYNEAINKAVHDEFEKEVRELNDGKFFEFEKVTD